MGQTVDKWRGGNDREIEFSQLQCLCGKFDWRRNRKLEVKFDKPIYMSMCILDISKVCLYEFHHELPMYRDKYKIMYTDTDSFIYYIECDDVYKNETR